MTSAATTHLTERLLWTLVMFMVIGAIYALMRRGWRSQQLAQNSIAKPREVDSNDSGFEGVYASTTLANQPLKRVTVHGLGARSRVEVSFSSSQLNLHRQGATSFGIGFDQIRAVSRASGIAGKVVGDNSLTIITWSLEGTDVDTGLLIRDPEFIKALEERI